MNANLSPPRRGFSVAPRDGAVPRQLELVPRLDMLHLDVAAAEPLGKKRQKLPPLVKSPRSRIRAAVSNSKDKKEQHAQQVDLYDFFGLPEPVYQINRGRNGSKRVRFHRNDRGRIVAVALGPQKKELTAVEMKKVWWSRTDLKRCRERAQEACRRIMTSCPEYKTRLVRMLDLCHAEHKINFAENMAKLDLDTSVEHETLEEICAAVVSDDGELTRGLEKRILNAMDVPFHRHRKSVQTVLAIQSCLDQQNSKHLSFERRAMLIASQYQSSARYAVQWAQEIAMEDAKAAHSMLQI